MAPGIPQNWEDIRATFWGQNKFLLGDFSLLTRFCALAQATDMSAQATPDATVATLGGGVPAVVAVAVANAGEPNA